MNEVIEYLPEMATAAGLVGGQVMDFVARRHSQNTETTVIDNYGPIEGMPSPETVDRSLAHRIGDYALRKAPVIVTAVAAGLAPIAWLNHDAPQPTQKPTLELVVDRPAQTLYDGSSPNIMTLDKAFIGDSKLNVNVILARGGSFQEGNLTPKSVENNAIYSPDGAVSMDTTTNVAIGKAEQAAVPVQSNVIGGSKQESGAILIDTDDDSIGTVDSVVNAAKQVNAKIYIANVGTQTDAIAQQLKSIAAETGGHYWDASKNTPAVANEIVSSINPAGEKLPVNNNNNWQDMLKALDIATALASIGLTLKTAGLVFKRKKV